jgi:hypothetical protein
VWEIERSHRGIRNIAAKKLYVNHYSFHLGHTRGRFERSKN